MTSEKRKRVDSLDNDVKAPSQGSAQATNRSKAHWFDDGNIILQAGSTLFKVHRGLLSKNSVIFRDMLAFQQPLDHPTVEGCPLVVLPDSEQDIHHFLNVLYNP
jgi:hypothetical protein